MRKILCLLILTMVIPVALAGCQDKTEPSAQNADKYVMTLYFSDAQIEYLVAETREAEIASQQLEDLVASVVNQLIAGPQNENLHKILPTTSVLNAVTIENQCAIIDLSQSTIADYWGGSSSELLTVYGLVNSVTALDGIEEIQILIEGNKAETLAGHVETSEPLKSNPNLIYAEK